MLERNAHSATGKLTVTLLGLSVFKGAWTKRENTLCSIVHSENVRDSHCFLFSSTLLRHCNLAPTHLLVGHTPYSLAECLLTTDANRYLTESQTFWLIWLWLAVAGHGGMLALPWRQTLCFATQHTFLG